MPNYYGDVLSAHLAAIKKTEEVVAALNEMNKTHDDEIAARRKAIDFNHEVIDLHLATNEKLNQIIEKYSDKQPVAQQVVKDAPKK